MQHYPLNNGQITFGPVHFLAHCGRTSRQSNQENITIYLNDFFRIRIQTALLTRNDQEYLRISYFQALTILHEIAHIMLIWSGRSTTPSRL